MNEHQTQQGDWGPGIPIYQALSTLAHLDTPAASGQTAQAFEHLFAIQNADGSWGHSERQWCTFLAIHALQNKGIL
jgi:hypothetical protein